MSSNLSTIIIMVLQKLKFSLNVFYSQTLLLNLTQKVSVGNLRVKKKFLGKCSTNYGRNFTNNIYIRTTVASLLLILTFSINSEIEYFVFFLCKTSTGKEFLQKMSWYILKDSKYRELTGPKYVSKVIN